jgi:thiol:disulfide interchange protein
MAPTDLFRSGSQRAVPLWLVVLAILLLLARIGYQSTRSTQPRNDLIDWVPIERAADVAAISGKAMMIDFTADWCPPCHELDAEVFRDPRLAEQINRSFVPVRVVDRRQEEGRNSPRVDALQRRYGVNAFPTVVFTHPDGTSRARMEGFRGKAGFVAVMEQAR